MLSLPVRNAGLPKPSKCRPTLESFFTSVPVAAQHSVPKREFAVCIVHTQIDIVHQNKKKKMNLAKHNIVRGDEEIKIGEGV